MIRSSVIEYNSSDVAMFDMDRNRENYVHELLIQNSTLQKNIWELLELEDSDRMTLVHEDRYINWIIADFTLLYDNEIRAIIECKAWDIWVTDYVRWIWQIMQYEYFFEEKIWKGRNFSTNFNSILLFPSSVVLRNAFNIWRFKYPERALILEINDSNLFARKISNDELNTLWKAIDENLITISQYYVRDNRLFELYLLLKYLIFLKISWQWESIDRRVLEYDKLRTLLTPNNQNWRNAFISLSSLWFINSKNMPTIPWLTIGSLNYEDFALTMYKSYLSPYVDCIMNYFDSDRTKLLETNQDICRWIRESYDGNDVLFLTQSHWRYISSRLNIIRDDFWCLRFLPRSQNRTIIYDIRKFTDEEIKEKIRNHSVAYGYIDKLQDLIWNS